MVTSCMDTAGFEVDTLDACSPCREPISSEICCSVTKYSKYNNYGDRNASMNVLRHTTLRTDEKLANTHTTIKHRWL